MLARCTCFISVILIARLLYLARGIETRDSSTCAETVAWQLRFLQLAVAFAVGTLGCSEEAGQLS